MYINEKGFVYNMKKILMVCECLASGVGTYVTQLCNDMCDVFDIYLAYSTRIQTENGFKSNLNSKVKMIEVKNFGSLKHILKTIKQLRNIEEEIKPDIIHLHSSIAGGIGRIAFKGKKNKVIYTPHGYAHILMGKNLKTKLFEIFERILGKTNTMTLTCCESENEVAKKLCKETFYIETGVNIDDLSKVLDEVETIENKDFSVYMLGRICTQKQPKLFNKIAEALPEVKFYWIGAGDLDKYLTAPNIEVIGWKNRKEALALAKGMDVFILCSLGEAISMSLIENMFMKKLCIVSNTVGNKSVIKNGINGYVCDNLDEYVQAIKKAMISFPYELTNNAYNDVLNIYNTKEMKRKYIEFYNKF